MSSNKTKTMIGIRVRDAVDVKEVISSLDELFSSSSWVSFDKLVLSYEEHDEDVYEILFEKIQYEDSPGNGFRDAWLITSL